MSIPTSRIAWTATGLSWPAGSEPAERTSTASSPNERSQPAAICERPALCTQTNSTVGLSDMRGFSHEEDTYDQQRRKPPHGLQADKTADRGRRDAGERVRQGARNRDCRIGEAGRACEPVRGEDVSADGQ